MPRRLVLILALSVPCLGCTQSTDTAIAAVNRVLDDFHDAAAAGDQQRYLDHLSDDAVFLGTDEQERWPKHPEFTDYVNSRFADGRGWAYAPVDRNVRVGERGDTAWFDEVVHSQAYGRFRGTGVLVREDARWKIAHYALSFLVYNEDWDAVVALTRRTAASRDAAGSDAE